jgi:hypothetical protein
MSTSRLFAAGVLAVLCLALPTQAAEPPRSGDSLLSSLVRDLTPSAVRQLGEREGVQMLLSILSGEMPDAGTGWFHPAQSLYDWKWLAGRWDSNRDGVITRDEFNGPKELFDRLDRNRDGKITPDDLDWSGQSPYWREANLANRLFRRADANANGRVTAEEWQALFKKTAGDKDVLTPEDLRLLLFPPPSPPPPPSEMPSRLTLLHGLLTGEIGSPREGPRVGQPAPDFILTTQDGKTTIRLSQFRGKKPVVMVFGSFT